MNLLLRDKMSQNPYGVCIGDRVYYLKREGENKFYSGCANITDIFEHGTRRVVAIEGTVAVDDVSAVMVGVVDGQTGDAYKLFLKVGEFTYKYQDFIETIFGIKRRKNDED